MLLSDALEQARRALESLELSAGYGESVRARDSGRRLAQYNDAAAWKLAISLYDALDEYEHFRDSLATGLIKDGSPAMVWRWLHPWVCAWREQPRRAALVLFSLGQLPQTEGTIVADRQWWTLALGLWRDAPTRDVGLHARDLVALVEHPRRQNTLRKQLGTNGGPAVFVTGLDRSVRSWRCVRALAFRTTDGYVLHRCVARLASSDDPAMVEDGRRALERLFEPEFSWRPGALLRLSGRFGTQSQAATVERLCSTLDADSTRAPEAIVDFQPSSSDFDLDPSAALSHGADLARAVYRHLLLRPGPDLDIAVEVAGLEWDVDDRASALMALVRFLVHRGKPTGLAILHRWKKIWPDGPFDEYEDMHRCLTGAIVALERAIERPLS